MLFLYNKLKEVLHIKKENCQLAINRLTKLNSQLL